MINITKYHNKLYKKTRRCFPQKKKEVKSWNSLWKLSLENKDFIWKIKVLTFERMKKFVWNLDFVKTFKFSSSWKNPSLVKVLTFFLERFQFDESLKFSAFWKDPN